MDGPRDLRDGWWDDLRPHRSLEVALDRADVAAINATARAAGQTPFVALAAVLHVWQWGLTGKTDLSLMVTANPAPHPLACARKRPMSNPRMALPIRRSFAARLLVCLSPERVWPLVAETGKHLVFSQVTLNGRTDSASQKMVGSFINDSVLRTRGAPSPNPCTPPAGRAASSAVPKP